MQSGNDVKQYNLTAGRSLPEWLDERKRRALLKKDVDLRRRLELLQDFSMPSVSNNVEISADGCFVLATGTYKPRVRCYDVNQLGLKFERCFDSEPVAFQMLSEDYSKIVFLQCDRYVELHAQFGRYYRLRVPKFGRDIAYNPANCDLYVVGAGSDVHRLNLEQGRFLAPMTTGCTGNNVCEVNDDHHLLVCGSVEGRVEGWDPRSRRRAASLDCALSLARADHLDAPGAVPQVTSVAFRDGLNMAAGTSTGHVVLYDIRSSRPLLVKDHLYGTAIKSILFHSTLDQVVSLDAKSVKVWDRSTGAPYTSIESEAELNQAVAFPGSGLVFLTNEQPKIQVHYIPSMGPAPRWCSFLDNITEEIEESAVGSVYDDYKFVTRQEIDELGLDHLVGSNLMRAYMHGFFVDARLYRKASVLARPYSVDSLVKERVDATIEDMRAKRVGGPAASAAGRLPKANKELYAKLKQQQEAGSKRRAREAAANLLADDRFGAIFTDERFQVDTDEETYKLLNPVISKNAPRRSEEPVDGDGSAAASDSEPPGSSSRDSSDSSSDDDREWTARVKRQHRQIRREAEEKERADRLGKKLAGRFVELGSAAKGEKKPRRAGKSLGDRIENEPELVERPDGHHMVFREKKSKRQLAAEAEAERHREERRRVRRSASSLKKDKVAPKFWKGKRVA